MCLVYNDISTAAEKQNTGMLVFLFSGYKSVGCKDAFFEMVDAGVRASENSQVGFSTTQLAT